MSFVHGYLLAGLVVLGIPVLLHLLHRQKPKQMPFPAFRFLKLKRSTNRRRMHLQNILLLLARLLVLLLIVLALARPQLPGAKSPFNGSQPVLAVLVFDTSPSMEYAEDRESRLDEARKRARELLAKIAPESKIRIVETGESAPPPSDLDGWLQGRSLIEGRLAGLRTRPVVESLPSLVETGVALLARAAQEDNRPRVLVVFGDRTLPSWPAGSTRKVPDEVQTLFVDVGVEKARDLAIESVETRPAIVVAGAKLEIRVAVRATGDSFNTELHCLLENDPDSDPSQTRQQVRLGDGERRVFVFERKVPLRPVGAPTAPVQVVARLPGSDPLLFNNAGYATVPARTRPRLLLISDVAGDARAVRTALHVIAVERPAEAFEVTQMSGQDALKLTPAQWRENAVAILNQSVPRPALWDALSGFVEGGGGLVIIPGGNEFLARREEFNGEGLKVQLLPGAFRKIITVPEGKSGVPWAEFLAGHPVTGPLRAAANADFADPQLRPQVTAYWEVDPGANEGVFLATYKDDLRRPALLEKRRGKGRVLLFTLPLDGRKLDATRGWHNYWKDSSFGLVLLDLACQDLAGRVSVPALRFPRGHEVRIALPTPLPASPFKLTGPGLSASETRVEWTPPVEPGIALPDLVLPQAVLAGNYQVRDNKEGIFSGFSLAEPSEENNLTRVPVETIEAVLGEKSVLPLGHDVRLADRLGEAFTPPTELLPLALLFLLFLLVLESWLANRYYKPLPEQGEERPASLRPTGELTRSRL